MEALLSEYVNPIPRIIWPGVVKRLLICSGTALQYIPSQTQLHPTLLRPSHLPPTTTNIESPPPTTTEMADDSSDLSSLSSLSPAPSGDESEIELKPQDGILKFFHRVSKDEVTEARKEMSPPPRKREPSPPHDYIFADNPDIAVSREPN